MQLENKKIATKKKEVSDHIDRCSVLISWNNNYICKQQNRLTDRQNAVFSSLAWKKISDVIMAERDKHKKVWPLTTLTLTRSWKIHLGTKVQCELSGPFPLTKLRSRFRNNETRTQTKKNLVPSQMSLSRIRDELFYPVCFQKKIQSALCFFGPN